MKKLAIIGASYLQEPLIQKAKSRGLETHVFAWETGDVGEKSADYFYPISIIEKDRILEECTRIGIDGISTISSDLANITVNYVADRLGLICNNPDCIMMTTNKHMMRKCFELNGDPTPRSIQVSSADEIDGSNLSYPVIVKPTDRSGSRGVTKVEKSSELAEAVDRALLVGFEKKAIIEEFIVGNEYSVEYISWEGKHTFLALTQKYTTGAPHFIEMGHLEPAPVDDQTLEIIKNVVSHALDSLQIRYGASHSEVMVSNNGSIKIIEIGSRMGGDNIGASLVELSTGYDYLGAVIDVALGTPPLHRFNRSASAGIRFIFSDDDIEALNRIKREKPEILIAEDVREITSQVPTDSSTRFGYYTILSNDINDILKFMPSSGQKNQNYN